TQTTNNIGTNGISSNLTLSGAVTTDAQGVVATSVEFHDIKTNLTYMANTNKGQYSIPIPNGDPYSITVFWAGAYNWQNGFDNIEQSLLIGSMANNFTYNINFSAPESTVTLSGNVTMNNATSDTGIVERTPTNITFVNQFGNRYKTTLVGQNMYSLILPNTVTYTVLVQYNGLYGTKGTCNAGTFYEDAGEWNAVQKQNFNC
ncbi:MAG: hypothetical protein ACHQX1_01870, partial [Candidatus Micrarchaeales archaeon]